MKLFVLFLPFITQMMLMEMNKWMAGDDVKYLPFPCRVWWEGWSDFPDYIIIVSHILYMSWDY